MIISKADAANALKDCLAQAAGPKKNDSDKPVVVQKKLLNGLAEWTQQIKNDQDGNEKNSSPDQKLELEETNAVEDDDDEFNEVEIQFEGDEAPSNQ